jgi:hypothetical protein
MANHLENFKPFAKKAKVARSENAALVRRRIEGCTLRP